MTRSRASPTRKRKQTILHQVSSATSNHPDETKNESSHLGRIAEQKRRQAIRDAFDRISTIVPGLEGQARSEGIVLSSTIEYIRQQMRERRDMIAEADAQGITIPADLRA